MFYLSLKVKSGIFNDLSIKARWDFLAHHLMAMQSHETRTDQARSREERRDFKLPWVMLPRVSSARGNVVV